jgi:cysteine desulfurase family protein
MRTVYLDNAATTYPKPNEVITTVSKCVTDYAASPRRGSNSLTRLADEQLSLARNTVASYLGARPEQIVFVPGATYGVNIAMQGLDYVSGDSVYVSPFEHNAVMRTAEHLRQTKGVQLRNLPVDRFCHLDISAAEQAFAAHPPKLVAIVHASNVSGDILPIKEVTDLAHQYRGKVLVDAAQTVGLHTPKLSDYEYDFLVFSSHKGLHGIAGAGGLLIKDMPPSLIEPLIYGGTGMNSEDLLMPTRLPERFEVGTHSLPAIVSMVAGIRWLDSIPVECVLKRIRNLQRQLIYGLSRLGISILGQNSQHGNIGVVSFNIPGFDPEEANRVLDAEGFCVRSGLHCAPAAHKTLGTFPRGTIRVSPGYFNTEADIAEFLRVIESMCV